MRTHPADLRALDALIRKVFCELVIAPDDYLPARISGVRGKQAFSFTYTLPYSSSSAMSARTATPWPTARAQFRTQAAGCTEPGIGGCYINQLTWTTD